MKAMLLNLAVLIAVLPLVVEASDFVVSLDDDCPANRNVLDLTKMQGKHDVHYSVDPIGIHAYFQVVDTSLFTRRTLDMDALCRETDDIGGLCCDRSRETCELSLELSRRVGTETPVKIQTHVVRVQLHDRNDHTPHFVLPDGKQSDSGRLQLEIGEDERSGLLKSLPLALDEDFGRNRVVKYQIAQDRFGSGDLHKFVNLQMDSAKPPRTLNLKLRQSLNREQIANLSLVVLAIDGGQGGFARTGTLSVLIRVRDVNDHKPEFQKSYYSVTVPENSLPPGPLLVVHATDGDDPNTENGRVRYQLGPPRSVEGQLAPLRPGLLGEYLRLDPNSGEIFLKKAVDFEKTKSLKFTVVASNSVPLVASAEHYNTASGILGPATADTTVTVIVSNEPDEKLSLFVNYYNTDHNYSQVKENTEDNFIARVTVISSELSSLRGGGNFHCELDSDAQTYQFTLSQIDSKRNSRGMMVRQYNVRMHIAVDRERISEISTRVVCSSDSMRVSQGGRWWKPIRVLVIDLNDNAPHIEEPLLGTGRHLEVKENTPAGSFVAKVTATDADTGDNARLRYSLHSANVLVLRHFQINNRTGVVTIKQPIDREVNGGRNEGYSSSKMKLNVTVTDCGKPPKSTSLLLAVTVLDVNDNKPIFNSDSFYFNIKENLPALTTVGKIEIMDMDLKDILIVRLVDDNQGSHSKLPFTVVQEVRQPLPIDDHQILLLPVGTRVFLINTTISLDCERKNKYRFKVVVTDGHRGSDQLKVARRNTASAAVELNVIDENDNRPIIMSPSTNNQSTYHFSYREPPQHRILQIRAYDQDRSAANRQIVCSIDRSDDLGNQQHLFEVHPNECYLYTQSPLEVQHVGDYGLVLVVSDCGNPAQHAGVAITVRVDSSAPRLPSVQLPGRSGGGSLGDKSISGRGAGGGVSLTLLVVIVVCALLLLVVLIVLFGCVPYFCRHNRTLTHMLGCCLGTRWQQQHLHSQQHRKTPVGQLQHNNLDEQTSFVDQNNFFNPHNIPIEIMQNPAQFELYTKLSRDPGTVEYTTTIPHPNAPTYQHQYNTLMAQSLPQYTIQSPDQQYQSRTERIPMAHHYDNRLGNGFKSDFNLNNQQQQQRQHHQSLMRLNNFHEKNMVSNGIDDSLITDEPTDNLQMMLTQASHSSMTPMPVRSKSVNTRRSSANDNCSTEQNSFAVSFPQDESTFV